GRTDPSSVHGLLPAVSAFRSSRPSHPTPRRWSCSRRRRMRAKGGMLGPECGLALPAIQLFDPGPRPTQRRDSSGGGLMRQESRRSRIMATRRNKRAAGAVALIIALATAASLLAAGGAGAGSQSPFALPRDQTLYTSGKQWGPYTGFNPLRTGDYS